MRASAASSAPFACASVIERACRASAEDHHHQVVAGAMGQLPQQQRLLALRSRHLAQGLVQPLDGGRDQHADQQKKRHRQRLRPEVHAVRRSHEIDHRQRGGHQRREQPRRTAEQQRREKHGRDEQQQRIASELRGERHAHQKRDREDDAGRHVAHERRIRRLGPQREHGIAHELKSPHDARSFP